MPHSHKELVVISIGGSIVVPKTGIDIAYLKKFRKMILAEIKKNKRFIIVIGGGQTAREYQRAANALVRLDPEDVDWLGIHATRMNGHLLRALFRDIALPAINKDPRKTMRWVEPVMIAAGWKPGWSTDYVAVSLAQKYGAHRVLNLTNIDMVYDADPAKNKNAKSVRDICWKDFRKIVGDVWSPGANAPFDPVASKLAEKYTMDVIIAKGTDIKNVNAILHGKKYIGTLIHI